MRKSRIAAPFNFLAGDAAELACGLAHFGVDKVRNHAEQV